MEDIDDYAIEIDSDTILQDFADADIAQYEAEETHENTETDILFE